MKLNFLQRWAYKLGIPVSILNIFAQEYYGYAVPNADGKYPDWWYENQGVPNTFRDCEVPKEILKRELKKKERQATSPRTYIRVKHGKIVEIVAHQHFQTIPAVRRYRTTPGYVYPQPQAIFTHENHETRNASDDVEADEIVRRVVEMRHDYDQALHRSASVPVRPLSGEDSDIHSFIDSRTMPSTRRLTMIAGMVDHGPLLSAPSVPEQRLGNATTLSHTSSKAFSPQRSVPVVDTASGSLLPTNTRPIQHQPSEPLYDDVGFLDYYFSPDTAGRGPPFRASQNHQQTPMGRTVDMETVSEWGRHSERYDEEWEDETDCSRRERCRVDAAERLREYRYET